MNTWNYKPLALIWYYLKLLIDPKRNGWRHTRLSFMGSDIILDHPLTHKLKSYHSRENEFFRKINPRSIERDEEYSFFKTIDRGDVRRLNFWLKLIFYLFLVISMFDFSWIMLILEWKILLLELVKYNLLFYFISLKFCSGSTF